MTAPDGEFEREAQRADRSALGELVGYLGHNKKWWLLPILIVGGVLGVLVLLAATGAAPFVYTLF